MSVKHQIAIVGAGGIGRAVGLILAEKNEFPVNLFIGDANADVAKDAAQWISDGCGHSDLVNAFAMPMEGTSEEMLAVFK